MTGTEYANLIASYIVKNYEDRGIPAYREVGIGKSISGKNRRIDILVVCEPLNDAFSVECKYQDSAGTVDEKIPYALQDIKAMHMGGCIVYAGQGFSEGVLHMLQGSEIAAWESRVPTSSNANAVWVPSQKSGLQPQPTENQPRSRL
ncbi:MAG: hypothetical protein J7M25_00625 [Deltaproteobacteria bacterium]|nr:hypothetical protein [Deltaproteobacteria bacterium]